MVSGLKPIFDIIKGQVRNENYRSLWLSSLRSRFDYIAELTQCFGSRYNRTVLHHSKKEIVVDYLKSGPHQFMAPRWRYSH